MSDWLPTPDQRDIVGAVSDALIDILPLDRLHRSGQTDQTLLPALAELGALGIALGEAVGGSGLSVVEEALIFEQLGRQLASPAVMASVLASHATPHAEALVAGQATAALAVRDAAGAILLIEAVETPDQILLLDGDRAVCRPGSDLGRRTPLDDTQWSLRLERAEFASPTAADDETKALALGLRARLLIAAQLTGLSARARDMAVDYAKIREQFGKPIGSFQAVKHHCADMAVNSLASSDLLAFAATALDQGRDDAAFQVQSALAVAIRAAHANAGINLQIHGGIGFSDECDAHLLVKHAHVWDTLAGGARAAHAALRAETSPLAPGRLAH